MPQTAFSLDKIVYEQEQHIQRLSPDAEYELAPIVRGELAEAIARAPFFKTLAPAGQHLVKAIHAVPYLYDDIERGDLNFYIGRAGATANHVYNRFNSHNNSKDHEGGLVAFRCATENVTTWEKAAIRLANGLKKRSRLCVANVAMDSRGALPRQEECVIYLTWQVQDEPAKVTAPIRADIEKIVNETLPFVLASADTLTRALDSITRPVADRIVLEWAENHEKDWSAKLNKLRTSGRYR